MLVSTAAVTKYYKVAQNTSCIVLKFCSQKTNLGLSGLESRCLQVCVPSSRVQGRIWLFVHSGCWQNSVPCCGSTEVPGSFQLSAEGLFWPLEAIHVPWVVPFFLHLQSQQQWDEVLSSFSIFFISLTFCSVISSL